MTNLKLTSIMICSKEIEPLKKFYTEVFQQEMNEMGGWVLGNAYFGLLEHSKVTGKNPQGARIMFNLETADVKAEFDRIKAIEGAEVVKEPYQMEGWDGWISTVSDPQGNYFQIMSPWEDEK